MKWDKLLLIGCIVALGIACYLRFHQSEPQAESPAIDIEAHQLKAKELVEQYRPASTTPLDDLSADLQPLLKGLPFVRDVEITGSATPKYRCIILRDWHFVPREMLEAEEGKLSEAEFEQHLQQVEVVMVEQLVILRCLIQHHGLTEVLIEGLTPEAIATTQLQAETLRTMNAVEADATLEVRTEIREIGLRLGTAIRLLASGELKAVLPLDRKKELDDANPVRGSKVVADIAKNAAREKAMVESCRRHGPLSVAILGGMHRLGFDGVQVMRITTKGYPAE